MITERQRATDLLLSLADKILIGKWNKGITEWAKHNVRLPESSLGDYYNPSVGPWIDEILRAMLDDQVEIVNVDGSAQSSKTTMMIVSLLFTIVENPCPILFYMHTDEMLKKFLRDTFKPAIDSCPAIKNIVHAKERGKDLMKHYTFPGGTLNFYSANKSTTRSAPARYVFCDEAARYKRGVLANAIERTGAQFRRKIIIASTPDLEDSDADRIWQKGTQEIWHVKCQGCGRLFQPRMFNIDWSGGYQDIFMKCLNEDCDHKHYQTDRTLELMNSGGKYVAQNPEAAEVPKDEAYVRSFRFNALMINKAIRPWSTLVKDWKSAVALQRRNEEDDMKEFVNLRLAEPWVDGKYSEEPETVWQEQGEIKFKADYRAMTIDAQQDHYYYMVGDWDEYGSFHPIEVGRAMKDAELLGIQQKWGVINVGIDSNYDRTKLAQLASRNGWKCFMGVGYDQFKKRRKNSKDTDIKFVDTKYKLKNLRLKNPPKVIRYCAQPVRWITYNLYHNKLYDKEWIQEKGCVNTAYVEDVDEYLKQMNSNVPRYKKQIKKWIIEQRVAGLPEHWFDCAVMQVAFALSSKINFDDNTPEPPENKETTEENDEDEGK